MIFKVRTVAKPRGEEKHCEGREADGAQKDNSSDCPASPALGEMNYPDALVPSLVSSCEEGQHISLWGTQSCELLFRRTAPIGRSREHEPHSCPRGEKGVSVSSLCSWMEGRSREITHTFAGTLWALSHTSFDFQELLRCQLLFYYFF